MRVSSVFLYPSTSYVSSPTPSEPSPVCFCTEVSSLVTLACRAALCTVSWATRGYLLAVWPRITLMSSMVGCSSFNPVRRPANDEIGWSKNMETQPGGRFAVTEPPRTRTCMDCVKGCPAFDSPQALAFGLPSGHPIAITGFPKVRSAVERAGIN
jgi:hypothetical protein